MDAKNERRVFDMLMDTSVKDNTAQYFLLTPKLLPDLKYEAGVTVIIVHNSDTMCNYNEWNLEKILAAKMALNVKKESMVSKQGTDESDIEEVPVPRKPTAPLVDLN